MDAKIIPLFRVEHPRHGTVLEVSMEGEQLRLTLESYVDGKRTMGIAYWMGEDQEKELFNLLLRRRVVK